MKGKDKKKETAVGFEVVKIPSYAVEKVREHKKESGTQIGVFFAKAAVKELDRLKAKEA